MLLDENNYKRIQEQDWIFRQALSITPFLVGFADNEKLLDSVFAKVKAILKLKEHLDPSEKL
ncbi:hypothetical protein [Dehalococcoides mccartyi]|uniref:hypothetical protein n=1 Tax=Dehalococcoides mccartyi TaxID=61435 RepID=UPI000804A0CC|nr:hypothetical protein [Dehalococcoides mccartyi]OBW61516.1 MAG: hypothetical protein A9181_00495 [Dehalococcoides mccartyi]